MEDYIKLVNKQAVGKTFIDADTGIEHMIIEINEPICGKVKLIIRPVNCDKSRDYWINEESLVAIIGIGES